MQLSERVTARSRFDRLQGRVRSILSTAGGGSRAGGSAAGGAPAADAGKRSGDGTNPADEGLGNLFHCPTCAIVYIDTEKRTCSQCDGDVRQVPSTFSRR